MTSRLRSRLEISSKLRRLRTAKGMSTRALAASTGLSQSRVTRIETGRSLPTEQHIIAIGRSLDLSQQLVKSLLIAASELAYDDKRTKVRLQASSAVVQELDTSARCIKFLHVNHLPRTIQTVSYMQAIYRAQETMPQTEREFIAHKFAMQAQELTTPAERHMLVSLDALYKPNVSTRSWLEVLYGFASRLPLGNYELGIVYPSDLREDEIGTIAAFDDDLVLHEKVDRWSHRFDKKETRGVAKRFDELALRAEWDGAMIKHIDEAIHYFEHRLSVK